MKMNFLSPWVFYLKIIIQGGRTLTFEIPGKTDEWTSKVNR